MPDQKKISELPALTADQVDDAAYRVRDLLWACLGDAFDKRAESEGLTYAELGRRIGRSRGQVQRWLAASHNMTIGSAGLIAEGLDAELKVAVLERLTAGIGNYAHPCEDAKAYVVACRQVPPPNTAPSVMAAPSTSTVKSERVANSGWRMIHAG